jgi:hypothetical protein
MGTAFTVQSGGSLAIEFPAFPDGTPAGVTTMLGSNAAANDQDEKWRLKMREAALSGEEARDARKSACAAPAGSYAVRAFFRPVLAPAPAGPDCRPGYLAANAFTISRDAVSIDLTGSAYVLASGKPAASLWSWAMANPVLETTINKAVPAAVSLFFGWITFRRTARTAPKPGRKSAGTPKAKRKPAGGK